MTADELGSGVYDDVCAVFDRAEQVGSGERAVHNQRNIVLVRDLSELLDVRNIGVRVAERFNVQRLCVLVDSSLEGAIYIRINELCGHAVKRKRVCQQVVGTTVDILCSYNVIPCMRNCLKCIS